MWLFQKHDVFFWCAEWLSWLVSSKCMNWYWRGWCALCVRIDRRIEISWPLIHIVLLQLLQSDPKLCFCGFAFVTWCCGTCRGPVRLCLEAAVTPQKSCFAVFTSSTYYMDKREKLNMKFHPLRKNKNDLSRSFYANSHLQFVHGEYDVSCWWMLVSCKDALGLLATLSSQLGDC